MLALALAGALLALAGGAVLFFFDPARHGFYPTCVFHRVTGLNCPGCGGLRALHQLAHGHVAEAFRLNALFVLLLPVLGWVGVRWVWRRASGQPARPGKVRTAWLWLLLAAMAVFGVLRNLPIAALAWLSP